MKSFRKYVSKHVALFIAFVLGMLFLNAILFGVTFYNVLTKDYGTASPKYMLEEIAGASSLEGITEAGRETLARHHIWAVFLNGQGQSVWAADVPDDVPKTYTLQDVAVFSKGYISDYPVFVWNHEDGLLVLGYPKDSYTKLTGNYLSLGTVKLVPVYMVGVLLIDCFLLFIAYYLSKRRIIKNTEPIVSSIAALSSGRPIDITVRGELSEVAESIQKASQVLGSQNSARANWISGVSHDIRTPLSMIMGYAGRISGDPMADAAIREQAGIIHEQSVKIRDLVQDLNLVSRLEYEMQPIHKENIRLSKLLRSYVADLLNTGIPEYDTIALQIEAEDVMLDCDPRLISRAISNLVNNSIGHNPKGCHITISLERSDTEIMIRVEDDGMGLTSEKMQELAEKPHYMESTDERLDLRHGLGILLVRQIVEAHHGTMAIESRFREGYKTTLVFPVNAT